MHTILLDRENTVQGRPDEADDRASTLIEAMSTVEKWQKT